MLRAEQPCVLGGKKLALLLAVAGLSAALPQRFNLEIKG